MEQKLTVEDALAEPICANCKHLKSRHRHGLGHCVGREPINGPVADCGCPRFRKEANG